MGNRKETQPGLIRLTRQGEANLDTLTWDCPNKTVNEANTQHDTRNTT